MPGMVRRVHRPSGATYAAAGLLREADALSAKLLGSAEHAGDFLRPMLLDGAKELDAAAEVLKRAYADLETARGLARSLRGRKDRALKRLHAWIGSVHSLADRDPALPRRPPRNSRNAPLLVAYAGALAPRARRSLADEGRALAADLRAAHDEHALLRHSRVPHLLAALRRAKVAVYVQIRAGTAVGGIAHRGLGAPRATMKGLRRR